MTHEAKGVHHCPTRLGVWKIICSELAGNDSAAMKVLNCLTPNLPSTCDASKGTSAKNQREKLEIRAFSAGKLLRYTACRWSGSEKFGQTVFF